MDTTLPAVTTAPLPTVTPGRMIAPGPINTPSSIRIPTCSRKCAINIARTLMIVLSPTLINSGCDVSSTTSYPIQTLRPILHAPPPMQSHANRPGAWSKMRQELKDTDLQTRDNRTHLFFEFPLNFMSSACVLKQRHRHITPIRKLQPYLGKSSSARGSWSTSRRRVSRCAQSR